MLLLYLLALVAVIVARVALSCRARKFRSYPSNAVGFVHPSSGGGGGGERVLWVALDALQADDERRGVEREYVLYTKPYGENGTDEELFALVSAQFGVKLRKSPRVVRLRPSITRWLDGDRYPHATLLLQTVVGGGLLFYECALANAAAPVMVESVGIPMLYPLLRLLCGSRVVSYTHFPVVSSAMAQRVWSSSGSAPLLKRCAKLLYYANFSLLYRVLGQFPNLVLTNSSWTQGHLQQLYWPRRCTVLFPPCDTHKFSAGSLPAAQRNNNIVSVGQFRPEKNHMLQLRSFAVAAERLPADARLVMIGGVRNAEDEERVRAIRAEAEQLGLSQRVEVRPNCSFDDVIRTLQSCCVGLHTMLDEHFGIVLLEYLAAGCVALGHRSGGVALDILDDPRVGFMAATEAEYANAMVRIVDGKNRNPAEFSEMQRRALEKADSFGDAKFGERFVRLVGPYLL